MKHVKLFEGFLNESTKTDFLLRNASELKTAIKQLKEGNDIINNFKGNEEAEKIWNETFDKIEKALEPYDTNVSEKIDQWVNCGDSFDVTPDEIADFALENEQRFGTEPHFVLEAIEKFVNILKKNLK